MEPAGGNWGSVKRRRTPYGSVHRSRMFKVAAFIPLFVGGDASTWVRSICRAAFQRSSRHRTFPATNLAGPAGGEAAIVSHVCQAS
ncbi:hypothetical protein IG631_08940 [Alternaria alternata]|nr:hypothetical protein IG631_08940 [Alternaria alternata]